MLARTQKHRNTVADAVEEICFREKAENAQEQYFTPALLPPLQFDTCETPAAHITLLLPCQQDILAGAVFVTDLSDILAA